MSTFDLDDASQGEVFDDAPSNTQIPQVFNDVFRTVAGGVEGYLRQRNASLQMNNDYALKTAALKENSMLERTKIMAAAAPSGLGWSTPNLLPQWLSDYMNPRSATLPQYSSGIGGGTIVLLIIAAVIMFAFSRR